MEVRDAKSSEVRRIQAIVFATSPQSWPQDLTSFGNAFAPASVPQIVYYRDTNGDWTAEKSELVSFATASPCTSTPLCLDAYRYLFAGIRRLHAQDAQPLQLHRFVQYQHLQIGVKTSSDFLPSHVA